MMEASSEEAEAVDGSSSGIQGNADADADCVSASGAVESFVAADAAIEMQAGDTALAGMSPCFFNVHILTCLLQLIGTLQQPEQMKLPLKTKRFFMTWTIAMVPPRPIQIPAKASANKNDFTRCISSAEEATLLMTATW